jgi:hypothetical protein
MEPVAGIDDPGHPASTMPATTAAGFRFVQATRLPLQRESRIFMQMREPALESKPKRVFEGV